MSCIQCHTAAGHPSLGVPAIDLTLMHRRLRPGFFTTHLLDPQQANPGTRMTSFWGEGGTDRIFEELEGGIQPGKSSDLVVPLLGRLPCRSLQELSLTATHTP